MSETVIKVENLSKKYIISHQRQERYPALRDVLAIGVKRMFNRGIVQVWKRHSSSSTNQQFNDLTSASLSNSTI
jgi:lipopolysaccharide transport system ATP-binding protein